MSDTTRTATMTESTPDIDRVIGDYFAAWNEADPVRRRALVTATYSDDATYQDPMLRADNPAEIVAMIAQVQAQFPGHTFRRTGPIDAYQSHARFAWALVNDESGTPLVAGLDVVRLTENGRLRSVIGFLDLVPSPQ